MERLLRDRDIILNAVVWADYTLPSQPSEVVLGVDYSGLSYTLEPDGQFGVRASPVEIKEVIHMHTMTEPEYWAKY